MVLFNDRHSEISNKNIFIIEFSVLFALWGCFCCLMLVCFNSQKNILLLDSEHPHSHTFLEYQLCVFVFCSIFPATFVLWVCKFLLLLSFCDCNIFILWHFYITFVLCVFVFALIPGFQNLATVLQLTYNRYDHHHHIVDIISA